MLKVNFIYKKKGDCLFEGERQDTEKKGINYSEDIMFNSIII